MKSFTVCWFHIGRRCRTGCPGRPSKIAPHLNKHVILEPVAIGEVICRELGVRSLPIPKNKLHKVDYLSSNGPFLFEDLLCFYQQTLVLSDAHIFSELVLQSVVDFAEVSNRHLACVGK
jgi:hypothetical protein